MQVNIHEAKTQLSRLIELTLAGERVTIARAGKPVVDLVVHATPTVVIGLDEWRHYDVPEDAFDGPDQEIADMFYGADA